MNPLENAHRIEIEKLIQKNEKMRQMSSREGFFKQYYSNCQKFETNKEAFDHTNEMYFDLFGRHRFADYVSFKNMISYYNKKK
jgi:hypothetical protein